MKNILLLAAWILLGNTVQAQEEKNEPPNEVGIKKLQPVAVKTNGPAFKVYELEAENEHWYSIQDVYSSLITKVPSIRISNQRIGQTPRITIRGDQNTIVIVDGIRYDASIFTILNPQDIQSIKVSADPAAATYFIANQN
ncbi:TonB-dependent receptor plug domain-containing protein [Spongiimicrobium salis]|uniref:TonB-dependent receptor plug domain-containing protein n=1 Tax=Spongiimicrobium salis TaxID=1667022 RepID=UPI00374C95FE